MPIEEQVRRALRAAGGGGGGDDAATLVIRHFGPAVSRYLRSLLREEDAAADAFSEWAERVWRGLPGFEWRCSLRTWVFRVAWGAARNLADEAWRRRRQRLPTGTASALAEEIRTKTPVVQERKRRQLDLLRMRLPVEDRSLLNLRIDQELPWKEVAEILSEEGHPIQVEAVQKRFERLRERLAELAREEGLLS